MVSFKLVWPVDILVSLLAAHNAVHSSLTLIQPELCVCICASLLACRNLASNNLIAFPANLLVDSMPNVTYL